MDLGIAGKWALVGGASKGLGWGCARALALEGVNVVMVARGAEVLNKAVDDLRVETGGKVQLIAVAVDITTEAGREAIWHVAGGPGKDYDIVVTNAGGPPPGDFRDWNREAWIKAIDANMLTPIDLIKATVDGMAARGFGRIVNITSSSVKSPIDVLGLSNGARSGLTGFVAGTSRSKIAGQGVTINNLLPGKFDTDRIRSTLPAMAQKAVGLIRGRIKNRGTLPKGVHHVLDGQWGERCCSGPHSSKSASVRTRSFQMVWKCSQPMYSLPTCSRL